MLFVIWTVLGITYFTPADAIGRRDWPAIERVWRAITDESESAQWSYGTGVVSTWDEGAPYAYRFPDGRVAIEGTVERIEPPTLLVMTTATVSEIAGGWPYLLSNLKSFVETGSPIPT
jgi:hypothetical protein